MDCLDCGRPISNEDRYWTKYKNNEVFGHVDDECYQQRALENFSKDGILTSNLCLTAAILVYSHPKWLPVVAATGRLHKAVKYFEAGAWFGGAVPEMKEQKYEGPRWTYPRIEKSIQSLLLPVCGLSGKYAGIEMLVYSLAGRAMVTLNRGDATITVITAEDEQTDRMGQQGICATEEQARQMLFEVAENWESFELKADDKVGMGF